jgi:hypothetical protein
MPNGTIKHARNWGLALSGFLAIIIAGEAAPFKIEGNYVRTVYRESGDIVSALTNVFTVILATNGYRIHTINPDFGSKAALPCVSQGSLTESTSIVSGFGVPRGNKLDKNHLEQFPIIEIADVENGGFPSHGHLITKALWVSYLAAELYGTNWTSALNANYKTGLINRKMVDSLTINTVTNLQTGDKYVQNAVFYADPEIIHSDGSSGFLVSPYDKGYRSIQFEVAEWMPVENRIFPQKSEYRIYQTWSSDANGYSKVKDRDDVRLFTKYEIHTSSVVLDVDILSLIQCQNHITEVHDWRLIDVKETIYSITNGQWKTMAAMAASPGWDDLQRNKATIQRKILMREKEKKSESNSLARFILFGVFSVSIAGPLLWLFASRSNNTI